MSYVLLIWTVVAIHGTQYGNENAARMDWRPLSEFDNSAACHRAAEVLSLRPSVYRCINKHTGEAK